MMLDGAALRVAGQSHLVPRNSAFYPPAVPIEYRDAWKQYARRDYRPSPVPPRRRHYHLTFAEPGDLAEGQHCQGSRGSSVSLARRLDKCA
jgi:hypothetical protein